MVDVNLSICTCKPLQVHLASHYIRGIEKSLLLIDENNDDLELPVVLCHSLPAFRLPWKGEDMSETNSHLQFLVFSFDLIMLDIHPDPSKFSVLSCALHYDWT